VRAARTETPSGRIRPRLPDAARRPPEPRPRLRRIPARLRPGVASRSAAEAGQI